MLAQFLLQKSVLLNIFRAAFLKVEACISDLWLLLNPFPGPSLTPAGHQQLSQTICFIKEDRPSKTFQLATERAASKDIQPVSISLSRKPKSASDPVKVNMAHHHVGAQWDVGGAHAHGFGWREDETQTLNMELPSGGQISDFKPTLRSLPKGQWGDEGTKVTLDYEGCETQQLLKPTYSTDISKWSQNDVRIILGQVVGGKKTKKNIGYRQMTILNN